MKAVRIIKRGSDEGQWNLQATDEKAAPGSREREIAITVRSWITERQQRKRLSEHRYWKMLAEFAN